MAIVRMSKFNLFSFDHDREELLKKLQKFGYVHFSDLSESDQIQLSAIDRSDDLISIDEKIGRAKWAIDTLEKYQEKKSTLKELKEGQKEFGLDDLKNRALEFDFDKYYNLLSALHQKREKSLQRIANIESLVEELLPWKEIDISSDVFKNFRDVDVFTGTIALRYEDDFLKSLEDFDLTTYQKVYEDKNFSYYCVISSKEQSGEVFESFRTSGFTPADIKTDNLVSVEISNLLKEKEDNENVVLQTDKEFRQNLNLLEDFEIYYEHYRNERLKIKSSEKFLKSEKVDFLEGFVPTDRLGEFEDVLKSVLSDDYYLIAQEAEKDDPNVPIILKNNRFVSAFESLTRMYSMPKYNEIDPTPLFAPFYFIFAGIMVGDFGYGALLFIATLIALKVLKPNRDMRKFIKFFNYLSISTMIWGLIFGSIFGGLIKMPAIINPAEDYMAMIILSILLGGIHLFFGLGIKAYMNLRDHRPKDALFDVGFWYMALIGAIVQLIKKPLNLNPLFAKVFFAIMLLGMIGILATGGRSESSTGGKIGWGTYALYGITGYIGDFVSYLRLMALALASSFIAVAVNLISSMLMHSGIIGIIAAIIIFVIFQLFNAFLAYLSAYVHSARLTYVEMFNKFYEGGGLPFKKFVEESKYFNIREE